MLVVVFITLLGVVIGKPCGVPRVCNCVHDLGMLTCFGENITEFPKFSSGVKLSTLFLDIINTNITELPSLKDWSSLEWVTLKRNEYLSCDVIHKESVFVDSDCQVGPRVYHDVAGELPKHHNLIQFLYALLVIPFGLSFASGYVCYVKKRTATRFSAAEKEDSALGDIALI